MRLISCPNNIPLILTLVLPGQVLVDDHVSLLQAFEVTAVPAVLGVVGGQVTEKFIGLISEKEVRAFVDTMISN